jgi:hypothetical protein
VRERNHWGVFRDPIAIWRSRIPIDGSSSTDLLSWCREILVALAESQFVFMRDQGTEWSYAEIDEYLTARFAAEGIVDVFGFAAQHGLAMQLAYFDEGGVRERLVTDATGLLRQLRPDADWITTGFRSCEPLELQGFEVRLGSGSARIGSSEISSVGIEIKTKCDIWFPWVVGLVEGSDGEWFQDNRALANRHTSRLNMLLSRVRSSVEGRGGSWEFINLCSYEWIDRMANQNGIDLDADRLPARLH